MLNSKSPMGSNSKFQKTSFSAGLHSRRRPVHTERACPGPQFLGLAPGGGLGSESSRGHAGAVWEPCVCACSVVSDSVTPGSVAHQAPLSMGFSRQKFWSGLPFPSLGDLPDPEIAPVFPPLAGRFFTTTPLEKPVGSC